MAQRHLVLSYQQSIKENQLARAAVVAEIARLEGEIGTAQGDVVVEQDRVRLWTEKAENASSEQERRDFVPQWRRNAALAVQKQQELHGRILALQGEIRAAQDRITGIDSQVSYLNGLLTAEKQS